MVRVRVRGCLLVAGVLVCLYAAAGAASTTLIHDARRVSFRSRPRSFVIMPSRIAPLVPGRPKDGIWRRTDRWAGTPPPVLLTSFRFSRADPRDVADVAWIRAGRTQLALYPGVYGPGPTTLPRGPEQVPLTARSRLLATFNSGFYEQDASAGFFTNGLLYYPMIRGLATVIAYRAGRLDIMQWKLGRRLGPGIVMARQNLTLFVDNGRVDQGLASSMRWSNAPAVWRTGLGIDRHGDLIYLAAPNLNAQDLARLLAHAGTVRAMELDINVIWPILVTYGGRGAHHPSLFVPNPHNYRADSSPQHQGLLCPLPPCRPASQVAG